MFPATGNWQPATALAIALFFTSPLGAATPSTCGQRDDYSRALCAYQRRNFPEAEALFRAIVDRNEADPQLIRATYFLARTDMKRGKFDEAATLLIRIYSLDPAFYSAWNCDFLLGECRKAAGKD